MDRVKIKRIVGMADNPFNNVIAELDNGFYAWVPTVELDVPVDYDPKETQNDYSFSYVTWARWVPVIVNGWVPPEIFPIAMRNFKKLFEEEPMTEDMIRQFTEAREDPVWSEQEQEAEEYCKKEFDASDYTFMNDLRQIFASPVDPKDVVFGEE